ncbi:zinc finger protein 286A isoform X1 [Amyelois transitella]|uniref:zinc finger protein 286A isoform X1 n=1 Tax=Amyelois transitella TaxID=680683 RepID=UPI00298FBA1D|nr:zinc finger protein 286A isoform X1 [Amyelois transitella]
MESKDEIMTFYGRCKCCLEYGYMKNMWKEQVWEDEREIYGEMLMDTFNIVWQCNTTEESICESCIGRLRDAYHFKKEVISSQQMLDEGVAKDELAMDYKNDMMELYLEETSQRTDDVEQGEEEEPAELKTEYEIEYLEEDADIVEKSVKPQLDQDVDSDSASGKQQTNYRNYTQADLKKCLDMIQRGMSQADAARIFNIPKKTLNVKISSLKKKSDVESDSESEAERRPTDIKRHRDNIRALLKHTNATPIKRHQGFGFTCHYCPKLFTNAADLKRHTFTHKNISESYKVTLIYNYAVRLDMTGLKCKICERDIDELTLEEVMEHLKRHGKNIHFNINNHILPFKFDTKILRCVICEEKFSYFKLLVDHMSEHYPNYRCKICNKGFVNKNTLRGHMCRHNEGVFQCSKCSKIFSTRCHMVSHERVVHVLKNKVLKCRYCLEKFVDAVQRRNHETAEHGAEPVSFVCCECNNVYGSQRGLTSHVKRCHLKLRPHKCALCGKSFFKKTALQNHMVSHTGEKRFECHVCGKCYGTRNNLRFHVQRKHCNKVSNDEVEHAYKVV